MGCSEHPIKVLLCLHFSVFNTGLSKCQVTTSMMPPSALRPRGSCGVAAARIGNRFGVCLWLWFSFLVLGLGLLRIWENLKPCPASPLQQPIGPSLHSLSPEPLVTQCPHGRGLILSATITTGARCPFSYILGRAHDKWHRHLTLGPGQVHSAECRRDVLC